MKRIWFAVIFLIIAAAACVFEQWNIHTFCKEINAMTQSAIEAKESGNKALLSHKVNEIQDYWRRKNDLLFALSGHVLLDELSTKINALDGKDEVIYDIKALVRAFEENNTVKFSNIL